MSTHDEITMQFDIVMLAYLFRNSYSVLIHFIHKAGDNEDLINLSSGF